jgi:hypothetical protein
VARFLSPEWVAAFNEAVGDVELPEPGAGAGVAASSGAYAWCQVVAEVPEGPAEGVPVTLRVAEGHVSMEQGAAPDAAVTVRIAWDDARAMALGELAPAEAIAAGRVRVRGDLAVLSAGQALLATLAPQLAGLHASTTY